MALIVEDGTGLSTAESYISVAGASSYHTARGNAAWAALASDTLREQALRRATDYMQQNYRMRWSGYRKTDTQALDWPRYEVPKRDVASLTWSYYENDEVPVEVSNACAELALRAAAADLLADLGPPRTGVSVGPISVTYADGARQRTRYAAIDSLLAPMLNSGSGSMAPVTRA